jgi:thioredoxin-related protein
MKKFKFLWLNIMLFCALPLFSFCQSVHFETWETWVQLQAEARAQNKYIFVDVFATWCGPCKRMDKEVYTNTQVGKALGKDFISVKIQQDMIKEDDAESRSHYAEAGAFVKKYQVHAFPSLLFFAPDGQLINKELGFHDVPDFLLLLKQTLDPQRPKMQAALRAYRKGKRDYRLMANLAIYARDLLGNRLLADSIARDYIANYQDKQPEQALLTRDNLEWLIKFNSQLHSGDQFFKLLYHQPDSVDKMIQYKGFANRVINNVVAREEIIDKLPKEKTDEPDWADMAATISQKYPNHVDANDLILTNQINYYAKAGDWKKQNQYLAQKIDKYGLASLGLGWGESLLLESFVLHDGDASLLPKAKSWIEENCIKWIENYGDGQYWGMNLKPGQAPVDFANNNFDDYAGLLYKIGRKDEAIKMMEWYIRMIDSYVSASEAFEHNQTKLDQFLKFNEGRLADRRRILDKMKKGDKIDDGTWKASWF